MMNKAEKEERDKEERIKNPNKEPVVKKEQEQEKAAEPSKPRSKVIDQKFKRVQIVESDEEEES